MVAPNFLGGDGRLATILAGLLGLLTVLSLAVPAVSAGLPEDPAQEPSEQSASEPEFDEDGTADESPPSESVQAEGAEVESDALRDPLIERLLPKNRVLVDKPGFTMETGGKIQVQYYDADGDDPDNEDEWLLRRFRPFLVGRIAEAWRWKFELELSSEITALEVELNNLDIRDAFVRYVGFDRPGRRLTLGNQKAPFSRDFLNPSTSQFFVERTFVGQTNAGVPDRVLGAHYRSPSSSDKVVLWATLGSLLHRQDVNGIRFVSTIGNSGSYNSGGLAAVRLDLRPAGALEIDKATYFDFGVAGYYWDNLGDSNPFTEDGESIDLTQADLDNALGLELSARARSGSFALMAQYNLIRAETVAGDFTGGLYVDGETDLHTTALQAAYRFHEVVQLVGGLSRLDADGYTEDWVEKILGLNLDINRILGRVQLSHRWITNRFGIATEDYQETRLQLQYVW